MKTGERYFVTPSACIQTSPCQKSFLLPVFFVCEGGSIGQEKKTRKFTKPGTHVKMDPEKVRNIIGILSKCPFPRNRGKGQNCLKEGSD
jgi:hypothetical protein